MKRSLMIAGVALLAAWGMSTTTLANCGSCGPAAKACPDGCSKPCCAAPAAAKHACGASCTTCPSKASAVKKSCPTGCTKPCCAKKAAQCTQASCGKASKSCTAADKAACAKKACRKAGASCPIKQDIAVINTLGLKALLDSGAKVTVLDARSGKYDDGRRIPGAKSLSSKASAKEVKKAARSKNQLIVTYCSNLQCPASGMLAERLKEMGYKNVIEYPLGIAGWADAGHDVDNVK